MSRDYSYPRVGPGDHLIIGTRGQYRLERADGTMEQVGNPDPVRDSWYMSPIGPLVLAVLGVLGSVVALLMAIGVI